VIAAVFWASTAVLIYHHLIFPVVLRFFAWWSGEPRLFPCPQQSVTDELPSVTLIVPAHNEASVISEKVRNLAAVAYPSDKVRFVIALDGCTDQTKGVLLSTLHSVCTPFDFDLVEYANNVGKTAVLNDQIIKSSSGIVCLTDASALIEADVLIKAAQHFVQPAVGVVCGTYVLANTKNEGERVYWEYQRALKKAESAL
jgi:cellulose synthase/poly-beta-1,6-N-acetylglucosamine synthase-like glycosyltransferase